MTDTTLNASAHDETFAGAGGVRLFTWCVDASGRSASPRSVVALVHGISEHSGRYREVAEHLAARGFAVCAFDLRGHGKSPGPRGHIDDWSEYRDDLQAFVGTVRAKFPDLPVFIYGHSLGALIVAEYLLAHQDGLAGAILSGIPIKPTGIAKPALVLVARMLSRFWPTFSLSLGVDGTRLTRDPVMVQAYNDDRMVHHTATARWGTETLEAIERVKANESEIRLPILILHGEADPVNSVEGSRELFANVSSKDKEILVYPGGMHEPHNDIQREQVMNDVETWLARELDASQ